MEKFPKPNQGQKQEEDRRERRMFPLGTEEMFEEMENSEGLEESLRRLESINASLANIQRDIENAGGEEAAANQNDGLVRSLLQFRDEYLANKRKVEERIARLRGEKE